MHLFVYGTLRRAAHHPMHRSLCAFASFVGEARVRGRLYRIDAYPGLVLDDTAGWVLGELYRLDDRRGLSTLDAYEGASAHDPEPREYRRVRHPVERLEGGEEPAWIYEYAWSVDGRSPIASGDFLRP